ncbi:MAG: NAD-binding protein [Bacteroidetes bacterium]|nr:NAD-binding protein [Bacteroidota bacterium]
MSSKPSFRQRFRYSFENTIAKGPIAIIGWLAVLSVLIVIIAAIIIVIAHLCADSNNPGTKPGFAESMWQSLMRTMDSGNLANDGNSLEYTRVEKWGVRGLMLVVTIGGIFILSTLIGTITSGLESTIEELRKGRSKVLENRHTLILGWSPKIFTIISELLIANENQKKPRIVILADKDKVEMEDEIRSKFPSTKNTKIICRTGSPLDLDDLEVASPHDARSVIILSPEDVGNPDTYVIKSILALTNNPNRKKDPYHIVAELRNEKNMEAAELVGGNEASIMLSGDIIARVTAQTCRQSGLSVVYTELMDFDGAEIYFKDEATLTGKTYREVISAFEDSAVMGMMRANGELLINPPMDTKFAKGDQVIAITEDDDTLVVGKTLPPKADTSVISIGEREKPGKERTLILGWNEKGSAIISELDNYVAQGSDVMVVSSDNSSEEDTKEIKKNLQRQNLVYRHANITEKAVIQSLDIPSYNHIILLCYNDMDVQEADAQVLITLLHLRNISEAGGKEFSIVSEMRDVRNRALAEVAKADDFIVSDKLISLLLSQISENKRLEAVFKDLFRSEGSEIYLKPAKEYVQMGKPMNFYTILEAASQRGETAIGYRITAQSSDPAKAYGVKVNPSKSEMITFSPADKIIVLAED